MPQRKQTLFGLIRAPRRPLWAAAAVLLAFCLTGGAAPAGAASGLVTPASAPVDFKAKELQHDDKAQTVTALGDVELVQGVRILRADKMVYHLDTDTVQAIGNVSLLDDKGDVHFAEYVDLSKDMKNGFVHGLLSLLADGSRFTADEGKRENGTKTTMTGATYTACKVCESDPHPLWQIRADKIVHDETTHKVIYKNAVFIIDGVPVAFTPLFYNADPTVKRQSGFLRPSYGYSSLLGTYVEGGYYFGDIAPDKDATLQVKPTSREGTLVEGEWRERFEKGSLTLDVAGAKSTFEDQSGIEEPGKDRGSIFGNGIYDLSDTWRAGFDLQHTSDYQFLPLYGISGQNVLTSDIYAERFSGRDYTRISAIDFQDERLGITANEPDVAPLVQSSFEGEPGATWGGRWQLGGEALGLTHSDTGDVQRGSVDADWLRKDILSSGLTVKSELQAREDAYGTEDNLVPASGSPVPLLGNTQAYRGMGTAAMTVSYPLVRKVDDGQLLLEPIVMAAVSPRIKEFNPDIPNEDSLDTELDANNLFSINRFPGVDEQEDGARVNYGVRGGDYLNSGEYVKGLIGQSYRLGSDPAFPAGSGLETQSSDVVGEIDAGISKYLSGDYHFEVRGDDFAIRRHEVGLVSGNDTFTFNTHYIYLSDQTDESFEGPRQQIQLGGRYRLNQRWFVAADTLTDVEESPGLLHAIGSLNYVDECFTFTAEGGRSNLSNLSGYGGTIVMLRIGFRNIGAFSAPGIQVTPHAENQLPTP